MQPTAFIGALSAREEFFYPDTPRGPLPGQLRLACARNALPGLQLLLESESPVQVSLESDSFEPEFYLLRAVPVEYNTGDGTRQGGAMVLMTPPAQKPGYATRLAPFRVYDCLQPLTADTAEPDGGLVGLYVCLRPKEGLCAGGHRAVLHAGGYACELTVRVYDVEIPADTFPVTNWFSLPAICRFHHVENGTPAFYGMVRRYARVMRRLHQTMFFLELDSKCLVSRSPDRFSFEHLTPLIETFFAEGMQTLELGSLLSRGYRPDGSPDMYTDCFKCSLAPQLALESPEGYAFTVCFVQQLADYLGRHGWRDRVVFHVHDEPDIHYKDDETLSARRRQYLLAVSILRRALPGVQVIEAVASPAFYGGVDLWVPGTAGYEQFKPEFDRLSALGEKVWSYVCCGPEGFWLNRFLDFAVLKGRLLFWGCSANRLGGYLHWGLNQFPEGMNPFDGTSCPNPTGIGTSFPCGDAFIVYPGTDGPWLGMRAEAARRGAEDVALLQLLRGRDPAAHDELVARVFRSNTDYDDDPARFEQVCEQLLALLEETGRQG